MAVFADPSGAVLCVGNHGRTLARGRVNDAGCLTVNELQTAPETASAFYAGLILLGEGAVKDDGKLVYVTIRNAPLANGGIMR